MTATTPAEPGDGEPTNQGVSAPDPAEGADDAPAGQDGSPEE